MLTMKKTLILFIFIIFEITTFAVASDNTIIDNSSYINNSNQKQTKQKNIKEIIPDDIDLNNLILMELDNGGIVLIELYPDKASWHVYRIRLLVANGFYDGLSFFRAIKNFMVQTGDPTNTGNGGSKFGKIQAEINDLKHERGIVSMARGATLDSADSQFFIVTADKVKHLDGQYTIFGKVIHGMKYIDAINSTTLENNGIVKENPTKIIKMKLVQDLNYSYEGDTKEQIEKRNKERLEILRNLDGLKEINDDLNRQNNENISLIDRITEFNGNLE